MRLRHRRPFGSVLPEAQHDMAQPACLWQQLCRGASPGAEAPRLPLCVPSEFWF